MGQPAIRNRKEVVNAIPPWSTFTLTSTPKLMLTFTSTFNGWSVNLSPKTLAALHSSGFLSKPNPSMKTNVTPKNQDIIILKK